MNKGFVTAFARRDQTGQSTARGDHVSRDSVSADEVGSLTLDPSIAHTAQVWIDPIDTQTARTDTAQSDPPRPHVQPEIEPTPSPARLAPESLQHVHIAYAMPFPLEPTAPTAESAIDGEAAAGDSAVAAEPAAPLTPTIREEPTKAARASTVDRGIPTAQAIADPAEFHVVSRHSTAANPLHSREWVAERAPAAPAASWAPHQLPPASDDTYRRVDDSAQRTSEPAVGRSNLITPFDAAWEVDVFDIPPCVADLFFDGRLFQQITDRMSEAVSTGLKSLLVTSTKPREGRTSAAIGLAMAAGAAGIRVALVDADTETPTLADDLRLNLQYGWVDTIRGGLPIKEVAVNAIEDGVTLVPLMPPYGRTGATAEEIIQLITLLRSKFELIILDGPSGRSANLHPFLSSVDSAIIIRDVRKTDTTEVNEFAYRLHECHVSGVGVVENFV